MSVAFLAEADDRLEEVATGKKLRSANEEFAEKWNFVREDNEWKLDALNQPTEDVSTLIAHSISLLKITVCILAWIGVGYFFRRVVTYLPRYFNSADVNNHVIGVWDDGILVQLYTCVLKNAMDLRTRVKTKMRLTILSVRLCCPNLTVGLRSTGMTTAFLGSA